MKDAKASPVMAGAWAWEAGFAGGDQVFGAALDAAALKPVVEKALELGIRSFDTAAIYGNGSSEAILGELLQGIPRESVVISTKFTPQIAASVEKPVEAMFEESLKRLGTDYIDLYWIHNSADVERWTPQVVPLLKEGRIRAIGVSNHTLAQVKRVIEILGESGCRLSAVQNHLSLMHRASLDSGLVDFCQASGIDFYSYMVLEQGALTGRFDEAHPMPSGSGRGAFYNSHWGEIAPLMTAIQAAAQKHGAAPSQIASRWAIEKGTIPILGVTKVRQVEEAAGLAALKLDAEDMGQLDHAAASMKLNTLREWESPED